MTIYLRKHFYCAASRSIVGVGWATLEWTASDLPAIMDAMTAPEGMPRLRLEPWADTDVDLERRGNVPEMTRHLGGVESEEQILARHQRFIDLAATGTGRMFRILLLPECEAVGAVGYWERVWENETVYEMGWKVLPPFQGRGIAAVAAAAAVDHARTEGKHRYMHAFPSVDNGPSNAICRKVGFALVRECDFEYPKGTIMQCNDWRLDLTATT